LNKEEIIKKLVKDIKKVICKLYEEYDVDNRSLFQFIPISKIEEKVDEIWDIDYDYSNLLEAIDRIAKKESFRREDCLAYILD